MIQSLAKGYEMLHLIISCMPQPISAFMNMVFAVLGIASIVRTIINLLE